MYSLSKRKKNMSDYNLGFCQCTFLCTTLKCIECFHKIWDAMHKIWNSAFKSETHRRTNPLKFTAWIYKITPNSPESWVWHLKFGWCAAEAGIESRTLVVKPPSDSPLFHPHCSLHLPNYWQSCDCSSLVISARRKITNKVWPGNHQCSQIDKVWLFGA